MPNVYLIVILFFALSIVVPALIKLLKGGGPRNKVRAIVEYTQKRGYRLLNPSVAQTLDSSVMEMLRNPALKNLAKASSDIFDIEGLENGTGDWLAFSLNLRSREATIFNFSESSPRPGSNGANVRYKVAKITAAGLPRFSLGKKSVAHAVEDFVAKAVKRPKLEIELNPAEYPEFSAHYWLQGQDPAAVIAFLSPDKLKRIAESKLQGIVATNANYLVYFENGSLVTEQDFDSFITAVEKISGMFL
ncbi:MAG TPA: hypothetical protein VFT65_17900 [Candidatus Angelobacter sp.]|nr:hypothetical protein [Candidatus Angelobacter sp.]